MKHDRCHVQAGTSTRCGTTVLWSGMDGRPPGMRVKSARFRKTLRRSGTPPPAGVPRRSRRSRRTRRTRRTRQLPGATRLRGIIARRTPAPLRGIIAPPAASRQPPAANRQPPARKVHSGNDGAAAACATTARRSAALSPEFPLAAEFDCARSYGRIAASELAGRYLLPRQCFADPEPERSQRKNANFLRASATSCGMAVVPPRLGCRTRGAVAGAPVGCCGGRGPAARAQAR
jgi:hypothetical protein